ncbi:MAG: hypothetical protein M0P69_13695 [Bacteroidales bacterium]|nr:hypothetical protein [Bacteroidales bacterium]
MQEVHVKRKTGEGDTMTDPIDRAKEQAAARKERERIAELLSKMPAGYLIDVAVRDDWLQYLTPEDSQ